MLSDEILERQVACVLAATDFPSLGKKYEGKVRDSYIRDDTRFLITTDRLSCFDVVVTSIPFKGQVLNQLALHWFDLVKNVIPNHLLGVPDPNVMFVRNCDILPVEVVVRAYIAGSAWRDYEAGKSISGLRLPPGLKNYSVLPEILLTPSTKAARGGHDQPISESEIISTGLVDAPMWSQVREAAFSLFEIGRREADRNGLILADTKYEFGIKDGRLLLADEIHTLDSSRYWIKESYQERMESGMPPEMLDKEPTRQWLLAKGFNGNGPIPEFSAEHRMDIARHYISSYEMITGKQFEAAAGDVHERIRKALSNYL
jgi:phosphoribosylaminoimidazole-succinocarboxamide synthase